MSDPVSRALPPRANRNPPGGLRRAVVAGAGVGLVVGAATQVLQGILPGDSNWIANSITAWVVVAFILGLRTTGPAVAAAGGTAVLLAALAGYEVLVEARFGAGWGPMVAVWALGGIAGGVVFGWAGWWWARGGAVGRAGASGLLAALFVAEGAYLHLVLPGRWVGLAMVGIGLVLPAAIGGPTHRARGRAYLALLPALALGAAGYLALLLVSGAWTGVPAFG